MARPAALWASLRPPINAGRPLLILGIFLRKLIFPEPILAGLGTMELGPPVPREAARLPQKARPLPLGPLWPYGPASLARWALRPAD